MHSSRGKDYLCGDLITADLMDKKLLPCIRFRSCATSINIQAYARIVVRKPSERTQLLQNLSSSFLRNAAGDSKPINTVFVPVHMKEDHWGVVVGKRILAPTELDVSIQLSILETV